MLLAQQEGRGGDGDLEFGLLVCCLYSKCRALLSSLPKQFPIVVLFLCGFGRCPYLTYFLQHISSFFELQHHFFLWGIYFLGDLTSPSCPGFTDKGSCALGSILRCPPELPSGPLENLQILVPHNRGSSGLITLLPFPSTYLPLQVHSARF